VAQISVGHNELLPKFIALVTTDVRLYASGGLAGRVLIEILIASPQ
jgi:hypothetical protein